MYVSLFDRIIDMKSESRCRGAMGTSIIEEKEMEEVLLVVAIVGGIAWWMHSGQTPAQALRGRAPLG